MDFRTNIVLPEKDYRTLFPECPVCASPRSDNTGGGSQGHINMDRPEELKPDQLTVHKSGRTDRFGCGPHGDCGQTINPVCRKDDDKKYKRLLTVPKANPRVLSCFFFLYRVLIL